MVLLCMESTGLSLGVYETPQPKISPATNFIDILDLGISKSDPIGYITLCSNNDESVLQTWHTFNDV